jgi:hypothetical protein
MENIKEFRGIIEAAEKMIEKGRNGGDKTEPNASVGNWDDLIIQEDSVQKKKYGNFVSLLTFLAVLMTIALIAYFMHFVFQNKAIDSQLPLDKMSFTKANPQKEQPQSFKSSPSLSESEGRKVKPLSVLMREEREKLKTKRHKKEAPPPPRSPHSGKFDG